MNDLSSTIGLMRRELRDVRAVASNIDHRIRKLLEPSARPRPGGLVARFAAVQSFAQSELRKPVDVARQHFADGRDLTRWDVVQRVACHLRQAQV